MADNIKNIQDIIAQTRRDSSGDVGPSGPPIWLISFTDVIALMLTFFVLLYSMTSPDPEKWDSKIGIQEQATAQYSGARNEAGNSEGVNLSRLSYAEAENLDYIEALLRENEINNGAYPSASLIRKDGYLFIMFDNKIARGQDFNKDFVNYFNVLTPLLKSLDNQLVMVGDSNREQTVFQMQALGNILRDNGYDRPISVQTMTGFIKSNQSFAISIQPDTGQRITR